MTTYADRNEMMALIEHLPIPDTLKGEVFKYRRCVFADELKEFFKYRKDWIFLNHLQYHYSIRDNNYQSLRSYSTLRTTRLIKGDINTTAVVHTLIEERTGDHYMTMKKRTLLDTFEFFTRSTIVDGQYGTFLFHLYKLHTFSVENLKEIIKGDNPYFKPFEKPPKGFYKLKKLELITLILKA